MWNPISFTIFLYNSLSTVSTSYLLTKLVPSAKLLWHCVIGSKITFNYFRADTDRLRTKKNQTSVDADLVNISIAYQLLESLKMIFWQFYLAN